MILSRSENNNKRKKKEIVNVNRMEAKQKLKEGEYILRDGQGKADFWKVYKKLFTSDGKDTNCVQCQNCCRFDEYDTNKGLKTMNVHAKMCNAFGVQKLDAFIQREIKLNTSEKDELIKAAVKFCYKDMRPFVAVEGEGLRSLLEAISTISAKYGRLSGYQLKEMLPVANTVNIN